MIKRVGRLIVLFMAIWQLSGGPVVNALDEPSPSPDPLIGHPSDQAPAEEPPTPLPSPSLPSLQPSPPVLQEEVDEPPLILPPLIINRVVAGLSGQTAFEYIELYNPTNQDSVLDNWQLQLLRKPGDTPQAITLNGTVKAGGYVLVAGTDSALDSLVPDVRLKANSIVTTGGLMQLVDQAGSVIDDVVWGDAGSPSLSLATGTMLARVYTDAVPSLTGDMADDFTVQPADPAPQAGGYIPYRTPVNTCEGVVISEIAANQPTADQFIELYNASAAPVTLDGCLLQTNRSSSAQFLLSGTLSPAGYMSVPVSSTNLTLSKTTNGTVYLVSSDQQTDVDTRAYNTVAEGASWAWFGGDDWRQTFTVSPGSANVWQEFLPCEAGYERNAETGRCRKIAEPASPSECEAGTYRNPETGRCRSVGVASSLTPCKPGQVRNTETNRCRAIASLTSSLAPCKEGQERNSATNRCRNVTKTIPDSTFKVQPTPDSSAASLGWWIFGVVTAIALGYGAWEWRGELRRFGQKSLTLLPFWK